MKSAYDRRSKPIGSPALGSPVVVQHPVSRRWEQLGTVVGLGQRRDLLVKLPSGRVLWRNRRFLRPFPPAAAGRRSPPAPENGPPLPTPTPDALPPPLPMSLSADTARSVRFPANPVTAVFGDERPQRYRRPPDRLQVDPRRASYE